MKRVTVVALGVLALTVPAGLAGCRASGSGPLDVHEAVLYGAAREHIVWVYGDRNGGSASAVTLNGQRAELATPSAGAVSLPGTLGLDGEPTYRFASVPFRSALTAAWPGSGDVRLLHSGPDVVAAYVTDGSRWLRLSGTTGTVATRPSQTLRGAGHLTDAEADAVGTALLHQGPLVVAVLVDEALPDPPLQIDPSPRGYQRTGLYVVAPTAAGRTSRPASSPVPAPGGRVDYTLLGSGTQANSTSTSVQVATTPAEVATVFALAYGQQTGAPALPSAVGTTVIGIFLGRKPTGGYSVKVVRASAPAGVLTVVVQLHAPGPGSMTTQALTSPWTLIQVRGTYPQVQVVDESGQPLPVGTGTDR